MSSYAQAVSSPKRAVGAPLTLQAPENIEELSFDTSKFQNLTATFILPAPPVGQDRTLFFREAYNQLGSKICSIIKNVNPEALNKIQISRTLVTPRRSSRLLRALQVIGSPDVAEDMAVLFENPIEIAGKSLVPTELEKKKVPLVGKNEFPKVFRINMLNFPATWEPKDQFALLQCRSGLKEVGKIKSLEHRNNFNSVQSTVSVEIKNWLEQSNLHNWNEALKEQGGFEAVEDLRIICDCPAITICSTCNYTGHSKCYNHLPVPQWANDVWAAYKAAGLEERMQRFEKKLDEAEELSRRQAQTSEDVDTIPATPTRSPKPLSVPTSLARRYHLRHNSEGSHAFTTPLKRKVPSPKPTALTGSRTPLGLFYPKTLKIVESTSPPIMSASALSNLVS